MKSSRLVALRELRTRKSDEICARLVTSFLTRFWSSAHSYIPAQIREKHEDEKKNANDESVDTFFMIRNIWSDKLLNVALSHLAMFCVHILVRRGWRWDGKRANLCFHLNGQ